MEQQQNYHVPFERVLYNNRHKAMEVIKCIMEILHNAIDADAKKINIKFLCDTDDRPVKLLIYNDGKEISKDEIGKVLVDGYTTRGKNELNIQGKFGVGAALASQNLSSKTTITSKNKDGYYDSVYDYIDMADQNINAGYTKISEKINREQYEKLGNKGVLFTLEALTHLVTKYLKSELEERLIRCIKTTFFDLGNKFTIKINDILIEESFDIINKSATNSNSIVVKIHHYKSDRDYISIYDEKHIGKKESSYFTYNPKRMPMSKEVLDADRSYKYCGSSLATGSRISKEQVAEEIEFWKSCSYYDDIKYNNLRGATFIRNNVSLNQNMERLSWDNQDFGDHWRDQVRWKLEWNNNEDLDKIYGIQTVKVIQDDTKHSCDQNFRWVLKAIKSRGWSYIKKKIEENVHLENEKSDKENSDTELESVEDSNMRKKNKRKDFSKTIQESVLKQNDYRCRITGTKLASMGKEGVIREDDHYDGDSSNNSSKNYHPITAWAHKMKTKDQNNMFYHKNKGDQEAVKASEKHFEQMMSDGYQRLHIKEIGYSLESLTSSYLDINGNKKDYSKYQKEITDLYTQALINLKCNNSEIFHQVFKNLSNYSQE